MKRNSLTLHKTRRVITGLIVAATLALSLFATSLTAFAGQGQTNHLISLYVKAARDHAAMASKSQTVSERDKHISAQIGCLQAVNALQAGRTDPGTCKVD
jgi:hypothetical protein